MGQCQLSTQCDDEIQVTETHVCARDLADCVVSHPRPDLERAKALPGAPTVGVSNKHMQVNLYLCALGRDGELKDTRFILVQAECPYVQSVGARVISIVKGS